MGLPVGYGKANNTTGRGYFQPGQSGFDNGKAISAGKRITELLSDAVTANDADATKEMLKALMKLYRTCDPWAVEFVFNRIAGKPKQEITGEDGGALVITLTREDADL